MYDHEKASALAAKQLGTPSDWEICSFAIYAPILRDADDVLEQLDEELPSNLDDVEEAINTAVIDVDLPSGWKLVAMREPNGNGESERKHGFVDFSSLGAA